MQTPHLVPLTPALLVAAANAFVGFTEQGGENRGQVVEHFLRGVHCPPGQPWCAAFVFHVGYHSHYDSASRISTWPLPDTASCQELFRFAKLRGALRDEPEVGDVFLKFDKTVQRYAHTGIVVSVDDQDLVLDREVHVCTTIEGNTNDNGSRDGYATLRRARTFHEADGHKFIRWSQLQPLARAAA
jgi:hypothetical protein